MSLSQTGCFPKQSCSSSGSLLFGILSMLARFMYVETQSVEGLNSIIRLQSKRCPNISLELLSSRLTIKRLIGQADGQTGCRKRWSTVKDLAATEVASLCDQATPCLQVLACQTRWAPADTIQSKSARSMAWVQD